VAEAVFCSQKYPVYDSVNGKQSTRSCSCTQYTEHEHHLTGILNTFLAMIDRIVPSSGQLDKVQQMRVRW
jgi:hypothetical protein